jgi:hypothetical protein
VLCALLMPYCHVYLIFLSVLVIKKSYFINEKK